MALDNKWKNFVKNRAVRLIKETKNIGKFHKQINKNTKVLFKNMLYPSIVAKLPPKEKNLLGPKSKC